MILCVLLAVMVAGTASSGTLQPVENWIQRLAAETRERHASGQVHIVEMDASSVAAIDRWPWPREYYGHMIAELDKAGARSIVFDVDFSTPSTPAQDHALAEAIALSRAPVVLPIFGQERSAADQRQLDALPIPELRENAALGSVSVAPDADGIIRNLPIGTFNAGAPRPSLAARIAGVSGEAGGYFPIDLAIDPETIPRHSFISVVRGDFDPGALRGKDVLIGATAIEMGDRYAVPKHGVQPGVVIQALGAETLLAGIPWRVPWPLPLVVCFAFSFWILSASSIRHVANRLALTVVACLAILQLGAYSLQLHIEIAPGILIFVAAGAVRVAQILRENFIRTLMTDSDTGMSNARAMRKDIAQTEHDFVVVAQITDFEALALVLGPDGAASLVKQVVARLEASGCEGPIYRTEDRVLAWTTNLTLFDLEQHLSGLIAVMRIPMEVKGKPLDVSLAFGIAGAGGLSHARHAASQAQRKQEPWIYHEETQKAAIEEQVSLLGELDLALERDELEVVYQPKLELATGRITSAEALVRWDHPVRGRLRPDAFILLAEEADRIDRLTIFVIDKTIDNVIAWNGAEMALSVAVNISARLLASERFAQQVEEILRRRLVPTNRLIFEVTESATVKDSDKAIAMLERFRDLGVVISMDDYGTGQSTLSYLKELPLSELKIDRSFVQNSHRDPNDALLVRSTVNLAHELGLRVVAEGVEDAACLQFLRSVGCDYAQGYHIGKPSSCAAFLELVTRYQEKHPESVPVAM